MNLLKTAGSYLLILHNLEPSDGVNEDGVRLLRKAIDAEEWQLCQELLRFFHSTDDTGAVLRDVLTETNMLDSPELFTDSGDADKTST